MSFARDGSPGTLLVVGLSRETAPVHIRERASLGEADARRLLRSLRTSGAVREALALSTCNRTDVYAFVGAEQAADAPSVIQETLSCQSSISREELVQLGYVRVEEDAIEHLFGVLAGLHSSILGEPEIVAQARTAVVLATHEGMFGPMLEAVFNHGLVAGRRVRADTGIARGAVSVSSVAVGLAETLVEDLCARCLLVIGAGRIARAVTHRFAARGPRRIVVANRSAPAATALAREAGGAAVGLAALPEQLALADVVVCATAAAGHLVSRRMLAAATRRREDGLVVLDLAVPRDVEPAAHDLPGVVLRDIDEIQRIAAANLDDRRRELPRAWSIVRTEAERFCAWRAGMDAEPLLVELRRHAERIRRLELDRVIARSPALDEAELARLDAITRAVIRKLLHEPAQRVRLAAATPAGRDHLCALSDLFGLASSEDARRTVSCWR